MTTFFYTFSKFLGFNLYTFSKLPKNCHILLETAFLAFLKNIFSSLYENKPHIHDVVIAYKDAKASAEANTLSAVNSRYIFRFEFARYVIGVFGHLDKSKHYRVNRFAILD